MKCFQKLEERKVGEKSCWGAQSQLFILKIQLWQQGDINQLSLGLNRKRLVHVYGVSTASHATQRTYVNINGKPADAKSSRGEYYGNIASTNVQEVDIIKATFDPTLLELDGNSVENISTNYTRSWTLLSRLLVKNVYRVTKFLSNLSEFQALESRKTMLRNIPARISFCRMILRGTWVFLMKEKSKVGSIFENLHNIHNFKPASKYLELITTTPFQALISKSTELYTRVRVLITHNRMELPLMYNPNSREKFFPHLNKMSFWVLNFNTLRFIFQVKKHLKDHVHWLSRLVELRYNNLFMLISPFRTHDVDYVGSTMGDGMDGVWSRFSKGNVHVYIGKESNKRGEYGRDTCPVGYLYYGRIALLIGRLCRLGRLGSYRVRLTPWSLHHQSTTPSTE
ncbi:hypothetical protein CR513_11033, partial [Mucuna pruriens]